MEGLVDGLQDGPEGSGVRQTMDLQQVRDNDSGGVRTSQDRIMLAGERHKILPGDVYTGWATLVLERKEPMSDLEFERMLMNHA